MAHPAPPCQASCRQEPLSLWQPGAQQNGCPQGGLGPGLPRWPAAGDCPLPAIYCPLSRRLVPLSTQTPGLQLAVPWLCTRLLPFTLTKMAAKCSCAMPGTTAVCMEQKNIRILKMKIKVVLQSAGAGVHYPKAEVWCACLSICWREAVSKERSLSFIKPQTRQWLIYSNFLWGLGVGRCLTRMWITEKWVRSVCYGKTNKKANFN